MMNFGSIDIGNLEGKSTTKSSFKKDELISKKQINFDENEKLSDNNESSDDF